MKLHTITAALAAAGLGFAGAPAHAQGISDDVIRIGVIPDMSGVYSDIDGKAGLEAVRLAIEDAGGSINGKKIEVVSADHQNKADVASARVREWFDEQKVDVIIAGTNSSTSLAMAGVAAAKKKPFMAIGAGASDLTNAQCSPYTVHYAYDTVALARGTGSAVVKDGGKSWFFLTADYAFGHALERDTMAVVKAAGGEIKGQVRAPLGASDFSSFLLQAGDYSATTFYLNAVKATGTDDADTVMKWMKSNKINDFFATNGFVREDGRMVHDMYLAQVKKPEESKAPWGYYKIVATLPGAEVYKPFGESACKLIKK